MSDLNLKKAKEFFYNKNYKNALEIFTAENDYYAVGLCFLLLGNTNQARIFWTKNKETSCASSWGLFVLDLIEKNVYEITCIPNFFQTRAQLEIYLNLFLDNNLINWAQRLIDCADILFESNPESYKFIARALCANGYFDLAKDFSKKSLKIFYNDPEAFMILAQSCFLTGDKKAAIDTCKRCLQYDKSYYPAVLFKKILDES